MDERVAIVRTGIANLASVLACLERCCVGVRFADAPEDVRNARRLILPGVGAFGAARRALDEAALVEPLRERIAAGRATLAICLGMQLFFESSEESPGVAGLGAASGGVGRFVPREGLRVPQLGWNRVEPGDRFDAFPPGDAYYANSYRATVCPRGWAGAWTEHGEPFLAAIQRGNVLACQFHPELSGPWGRNVVRAWLEKNA